MWCSRLLRPSRQRIKASPEFPTRAEDRVTDASA